MEVCTITYSTMAAWPPIPLPPPPVSLAALGSNRQVLLPRGRCIRPRSSRNVVSRTTAGGSCAASARATASFAGGTATAAGDLGPPVYLSMDLRCTGYGDHGSSGPADIQAGDGRALGIPFRLHTPRYFSSVLRRGANCHGRGLFLAGCRPGDSVLPGNSKRRLGTTLQPAHHSTVCHSLRADLGRVGSLLPLSRFESSSRRAASCPGNFAGNRPGSRSSGNLRDSGAFPDCHLYLAVPRLALSGLADFVMPHQTTSGSVG